MRTHYPHVPKTETMYLVIDNAGGHGSDANWDLMTKEMREQHNIELTRQPPNSPDLNWCDRGGWKSMASHVAKLGREMRRDKEVLWRCMQRGYEEWSELGGDGKTPIEGIAEDYPALLRKVIASGGTNNHEMGRGAAVPIGAAPVAVEEVDEESEASSEEECEGDD